MTPLQKRCQHLLNMNDLFRAAVAGIAIERQQESGWCEVRSSEEPYFEEGFTYRIKPEPKYRPFTPEEALKHVGREFCHRGHKPGETYWSILGVSPRGFVNRPVLIPENTNVYDTTFTFLCTQCVFRDDGTPCGVAE